MALRRTLATLIALAVVGALLGALAGIVTVTAGTLAISIRNGHVEWPLTAFGALFGSVFGGGLGALLAPAVAFTPWRYIPVGRLFAHLTVGTTIGGCAGILVVPHPMFPLMGGIAGFIIAGDRLARRYRSEGTAATSDNALGDTMTRNSNSAE